MIRSGTAAAVLALFTMFGNVQAVEARGTITDIVAKSGGEFDRNRYDYDILLNAVLTAELDGALADPEARLTVFAPNDMGFIRLARDLGYQGYDEAGTWAFLVEVLTGLGNGNPIPVLRDILLYHVVPEKVGVFGFVLAAIRDQDIPTLLGTTLDPFLFGLVDQEPDLRNPRLFFPINVRASNGIIHTLDGVLIPVDLP
ncbi:MAG: fasciclin domain-containing protein [Thiohalobacterales bacterium]|nr:fasciclin domain-containing protein [Thiohalobacterales bacterium]